METPQLCDNLTTVSKKELARLVLTVFVPYRTKSLKYFEFKVFPGETPKEIKWGTPLLSLFLATFYKSRCHRLLLRSGMKK